MGADLRHRWACRPAPQASSGRSVGCSFAGLVPAQSERHGRPRRTPDGAGASTGVQFYLMPPVLCMESRVHNVVGLSSEYDTEQGRKQLRVSILFAREFLLDVLYDERRRGV